MQFFKRVILLTACTLLLSACVTPALRNNKHIDYQEDILLKADNHSGLISLYRRQLKNKEDPQVRFKLAHYYYQAGDYRSSLYYLQPLAHQPDIPVALLQARNRIALGDYAQALQVTNAIRQRDPKNAEAWNLRGIALALSGQPAQGREAIERARALFIDDEVALNNLAAIAMMEQRYQEVVGLLLPQYLQGKKSPRLLHNLVLSLVKVGDYRDARRIIASENLSDRPDDLLNALAHLTPDSREMG